ncbi:MAG: RidA family protein [Actinomycetota bacterium]|nr:RidA family protein [Actinomycetota bacterium]
MSGGRLDTGGPWEEAFGYSRAVRVGERILVSGCTSTRDGVVRAPSDPAAQLRLAAETALAAVVELGGSVDDVVRTRLYVTHRRDCEAIGRMHGELFGAVRPATTMVVVAGLLHPDMRVEIEVEAVVGTGSSRTGPT